MGYGDDIMALGEIMEIVRNSDPSKTMVSIGGKYYRSPVYLHHPYILPPIKKEEKFYKHYKEQYKASCLNSNNVVDVIGFNWNKLKRYGLFYMKEGYKEKAKTESIILCKKYKPKIADIYFRDIEVEKIKRILREINIKKFIFIQPTIKDQTRENKQWGLNKYQELINMLKDKIDFITCIPMTQRSSRSAIPEANKERSGLSGVTELKTYDIRAAITVLSQASAFIGNEGAMHHAAGALNIPGAVMFGHFISPESTGYNIHKNYFYDDGTEENKYGCGIWGRECETCRFAMNSFSPEAVCQDILKILKNPLPEKRLFINPNKNYGYMSKGIEGKFLKKINSEKNYWKKLKK